MPSSSNFKNFQTAIAAYGKENLGELLYALAENAKLLSGCEQVRIYLEDLTRGSLACVHATGPFGKELGETTFPIISKEAVVSSVFVSQLPKSFKLSAADTSALDHDCAIRFKLRSSYVMPVVSMGKSIGVLCIDRDQPGEAVSNRAKAQLAELSDIVATPLDQARIYHQQVRLARRLEEFKVTREDIVAKPSG